MYSPKSFMRKKKMPKYIEGDISKIYSKKRKQCYKGNLKVRRVGTDDF